MDGFDKMSYFRGVPRQLGRGLGAFAGTIARTTFPILRKYVLPVAKKLGRDVIESAIPELDQVIKGKASIKKAVKRTAKATAKKQFGGGRVKRKSKQRRKRGLKKKIIKQKAQKQRSRDDFFKNVT